VRLTILGGCGAWPAAGEACSGYLVEEDGYRLLIDPGYAVVPRLLQRLEATDVDAVLVSHGHPDHCADLNPLLRARAFGRPPARPLAVHALPGALDAVLALDGPGMLGNACELREIEVGRAFRLGPWSVGTAALPHSLPNVGVRLSSGGSALVYTGDAGPAPELLALAHGADLLLAEASYVDEVPATSRGNLSSALDAGRQAAEAGVRSLVLTHLLPGADRRVARIAARRAYGGPVSVARGGAGFTVGAV
jgi:ribonuclease BN (tRNA processing enzyme)